MPTLAYAYLAASGATIYGGRFAPDDPHTFQYTIEKRARTDRWITFVGTFSGGQGYDRFQQRMVRRTSDGSTATLQARIWDMGASGLPTTFNGSSYTLLVDGTSVATASPATVDGQATLTFTFSLTSLSEGYHIVDVGGMDASESAMAYGLYINKGGSTNASAWVPVITGSYEQDELQPHSGRYQHIVKVPSLVSQRTKPLDLQLLDRTPIATATSMTAMTAWEPVPMTFGDTHEPNVDTDGILSSYNIQNYFFSQFLDKKPRLPLMDGPRGVGTMPFATHMRFSKRPAGSPGSRKVYFTDAWRFAVMDEDGGIRTLCGWRHKNPPAYWNDPGLGINPVGDDPNLELVGDWSSVPADRRGLHEPWGFDWADATLTVNTSAAPVYDSPHQAEHPHVTGPVCFIADTRNNRIIKAQFLATQHTPAVCTEFITGLSDPWSIVYLNAKLYITERTGHKISVYDAVTGAFVKNLVAATVAMSVVNADRNHNIAVNPDTGQRYTHADISAQPCVGPESILFRPRDGRLYYTSRPMQAIKSVDPETGAWTTYMDLSAYTDIYNDGNMNFANMSMSDGTFMAEGTVFMSTWSNVTGFPFCFLPDGSRYGYNNTTHAGTPVQPNGVMYTSAQAIGQGMLVCAGALSGCIMMGLTRPSDPVYGDYVDDADPMKTGATAYQSAGFHLAMGNHGWGKWGIPLPWSADSVPGSAANIDTFLKAQGHFRVPTWRRGLPLNQWYAIPGTASGDNDGRMAFSGLALQDTILWRGPSGGHEDESANDVISIDLLADSPTWVQRVAGTPAGAARTREAAYYTDGLPTSRHVYSSAHYSDLWNRVYFFGAKAVWGNGGTNFPNLDGINPKTNTWEVAASTDAAPVYAQTSCMDQFGDVWTLSSTNGIIATNLVHWNRHTRAPTVVQEFGDVPAGGPIAWDTRRQVAFSLSFGNGQGQDTDVRAFLYFPERNPTSGAITGATRTAITLTSIGGALAQFSTDAAEYGGMEFDADLGAFLFYDGRTVGSNDRRGRVFKITPAADFSNTTWTIEVMSTAGTVPGAVVGAGVNSRWRYVAKLRGWVVMTSGADTLRFLPTGAL